MKVSGEKPQFAKGKEAGTKSGATGWGHSRGGALTLDIKSGLSTGAPGRERCLPLAWEVTTGWGEWAPGGERDAQ